MLAETAFSVFEALPPMEKQRLLKMLSVSNVKEKKVIVKNPILTDSQARLIIINNCKRFSKRWKNKMAI
jgi:hypothetical protein